MEGLIHKSDLTGGMAMRLPRMTIRRWMIAAAVVALLIYSSADADRSSRSRPTTDLGQGSHGRCIARTCVGRGFSKGIWLWPANIATPPTTPRLPIEHDPPEPE